MKRIHRLCVILVLAPLLISGFFLLDSMGLQTSLLTKLFIVFVGMTIGLQSVPALLTFSGLIKETCDGRSAIADKSTR